MELNGDIVRQLYSEITFGKRTGRLVGRANDGFICHARFSRLPCLKAFYRFFEAVSEALPDYRLLLENIVVRGNRVMVRYTISGTHKREFMGLTATHKQATITGIHVFHLDEGRVAEYWDGAPQMTSTYQETRKRPSTWSPGKLAGAFPERKQVSLGV